MNILCIDVGTGTQDILLFDSSTELENCVQMVMPSPTQIVARKVRESTAAGRTLLLTGVTMGGGPCGWAIEDHLKAGLRVYATPEAARTLDDDLDRVAALGVTIADEREIEDVQATVAQDGCAIELRDVDMAAVASALGAFGEPARYDAVAVAAFDHGAAPPGYSDRRFRFDYISQKMEEWGDRPAPDALASFGSAAGALHPDLTRLQAVTATVRRAVGADLPVFVMDTGPAALLGSYGDGLVRDAASRNALFVNVGNFHTLGFHISGNRIRALFEHHTGLLDGPRLVGLLERLATGTLANDEVFADSGHGALVVGEAGSGPPELCAVTGPRRGMLDGVAMPWPLLLAVPHGDMMLAGCYGLLRAFAAHFPWSEREIMSRLEGGREAWGTT
jgi:uncharacterized protein (DUF1786 family)